MKAKVRLVEFTPLHAKLSIWTGPDADHLKLAGQLVFDNRTWEAELRATVDALNYFEDRWGSSR
jgi:hypothetical protein